MHAIRTISIVWYPAAGNRGGHRLQPLRHQAAAHPLGYHRRTENGRFQGCQRKLAVPERLQDPRHGAQRPRSHRNLATAQRYPGNQRKLGGLRVSGLTPICNQG